MVLDHDDALLEPGICRSTSVGALRRRMQLPDDLGQRQESVQYASRSRVKWRENSAGVVMFIVFQIQDAELRRIHAAVRDGRGREFKPSHHSPPPAMYRHRR